MIKSNTYDGIVCVDKFIVLRFMHLGNAWKGNVQNYLVILDNATKNLSWSTIQFITLQTLYDSYIQWK